MLPSQYASLAVRAGQPTFFYLPTTESSANQLPAAVEIYMIAASSAETKRLGANLPAMPSIANAEALPAAVNAYLDALVNAGLKSAELYSTTVTLDH
ncbi:MAG TPA: hypothetical protein VIS74_07385 [Chthoniobacterales bacterium]